MPIGRKPEQVEGSSYFMVLSNVSMKNVYCYTILSKFCQKKPFNNWVWHLGLLFKDLFCPASKASGTAKF